MIGPQRLFSRRDVRRAGFYLAGGSLVLVVPVALWVLDLPLILYSWGPYYQVFELFGFCAALFMCLAAVLEFRRLNGTRVESLLLVVLPFAVCFHYLSLISDYSARSGDYLCYEAAAKAILEGTNPYGKCYFYPPLVAQVMALAFRIGEWGTQVLHRPVAPLHIWYIVFYVYQGCQFYLIALAYLLAYRLAMRMGAPRLIASALVAVLLLFNNGLIRTLRHNQVNLWILDLELLALVALAQAPWVAGLATAVAGHIKLYPLILLGPWALTRRWRAVLWTLVGLVVVVLIQMTSGRSWELWGQYLVSPFADPKVIVFRNNSLQSIVFNTFRALRYLIGRDLAHSPLVDVVRVIASAAVAGWFAVRFVQRERVHRSQVMDTEAERMRQYGHAVDALALALIVSPSVWVHQYILSLPIALWAAVTRGRQRPWLVTLGVLLTTALPVFDVFPFSYHRIVGLTLFITLTSPRAPLARWGTDAVEMQTQ